MPDTDALLAQLQASARRGDHVVFMSNGGFDGNRAASLPRCRPMSVDGPLPLPPLHTTLAPRCGGGLRVFERRYLIWYATAAAVVRALVSA